MNPKELQHPVFLVQRVIPVVKRGRDIVPIAIVHRTFPMLSKDVFFCVHRGRLHRPFRRRSVVLRVARCLKHAVRHVERRSTTVRAAPSAAYLM